MTSRAQALHALGPTHPLFGLWWEAKRRANDYAVLTGNYNDIEPAHRKVFAMLCHDAYREAIAPWIRVKTEMFNAFSPALHMSLETGEVSSGPRAYPAVVEKTLAMIDDMIDMEQQRYDPRQLLEALE